MRTVRLIHLCTLVATVLSGFSLSPDGVQFVAGADTTEFVKKWQPKPGDIVSFKHHGFLLASKKPKFPTLYRVRSDLTWETVVDNWKEQKHAAPGIPFLFLDQCDFFVLTKVSLVRVVKSVQPRIHPRGYWLKREHRRKFFCDYAAKMGFDPLDTANWHHVTWTEIERKVRFLSSWNCDLFAGREGQPCSIKGTLFPRCYRMHSQS